MRKAYSSDISREQFELISDILGEVKVKTKEREVDLYEVYCAIQYRIKNGCTWGNLPHDFPPYSTVFYYYRRWRRVREEGYSMLDEALEKLTEYDRLLSRREINPSMLIADSKTIQNADSAEEKGYDGAKKKSGVKIHVAVDILGSLYAACATTANVTDRDGAIEMLSNLDYVPPRLEKILFDGAYTGKDFAAKIKDLVDADVEVVKRNELHTFVVIPKRWVVERFFGWLDKCRLLWKNCETFLSSTLAAVKFAFLSILLRRFKKKGNSYVK